MSTHNLCFGAKKKRKIGIPCIPQFCYIKVGFKGYTLHGHVFLMDIYLYSILILKGVAPVVERLRAPFLNHSIISPL